MGVTARRQTRGDSTPPLTVALGGPGFTPLMRAGLGGLAASLRAIAEADSSATWPESVPLGPGRATVGPSAVTIDWNGAAPVEVLGLLFERSFRVTKAGLIDFPGTYRALHPPPLAVATALQDGLKRTFLQHGKSTRAEAPPRIVQVEIDDRRVPVKLQPYETYRHRLEGAKRVAKALKSKTVELPGWAHPGGVQRHISFPSTKCHYSPEQALALLFAPIGTLSLVAPAVRGGVLVICQPSNLLDFAEVRPLLTPSKPADVRVAGTGDAVLAVELALREFGDRRGLARIAAVLLRATPWDNRQKYRVATLEPAEVANATLDAYERASRRLPARCHLSIEGKDKGDTEGYWTTSSLRGFVTDNLARGRAWYDGFATARTEETRPRYIHYYRERDNLGALFMHEREGLSTMVEKFDDVEAKLVASVHTALSHRFGAIADETAGAPAAMKNRFQSERDRWRYAFAGARTHGQIRKALADLWSRAGTNSVLREAWPEILPLLRADRWQTARDLALVALASYAGRGSQLPDREDNQ